MENKASSTRIQFRQCGRPANCRPAPTAILTEKSTWQLNTSDSDSPKNEIGQGQLIQKQGRLIPKQGRLIPKQGRLIPKPGTLTKTICASGKVSGRVQGQVSPESSGRHFRCLFSRYLSASDDIGTSIDLCRSH